MKIIRCCFTVVYTILFTVSHAQQSKWMHFNWEGDSIGGRYIKKTAINIPIQIDNLPYKFTAQFDLGAYASCLYGNSIAPYLKVAHSLNKKIDTSDTVWINSQPNLIIKGIALKIDGVYCGKRDFIIYKGYGDSLTTDSVKTITIKEIGTIGADLFQKKILIIDYPHQRLCVTDKLPDSLARGTDFVNMLINNTRIKIPFEINGKKEYLMFDTGSSLFALETDKKNANSISGKSISDSLQVYAWGKYHPIYGRIVQSVIKIGTIIMPQALVYYDADGFLDGFFVNQHIWGLAGSRYFLNDIVIIDYKSNRFGIYVQKTGK